MKKSEDLLDRVLNNKKLEISLRASHITIPVDQYLMLTILMSVFSCVLIAMIGMLLFVMDREISSIVPTWSLILLGCILVPIGIFACFYYYPILEAHGRKSKIDLDLPFAITYMQALSSTMTLYEIIRNVYDAADLYREVSKECGLIVRDVELFGEDLLTAMENMIKITPSDNFRELLNDLCLIYRSGGNLSNFFNAKSESYRELARQELESLLQFLEMIAEIYVTAFVAGPIAIIIMLVAENLSGQSTMGNILPLMYIFLPLGAITLIAILYILLPPDNLDITKREIRDSEFGTDLLVPGKDEKPDAEFHQTNQFQKEDDQVT